MLCLLEPQRLWNSVQNFVFAATIALLGLAGSDSPAPAAETKPNILLIVADDLGYSDIGCFGGNVRTPNIDALAARGLKATSFCVGPTCSPTRSMLLTGCDHHVAGLGNMHEFTGPEQKGKPGYEGHLNERVVSVAEVLKKSGYHTYMAGKWHLGEEPAAWPAAKGFERDFTLMQGGGSNWEDMGYPDPKHPRLTFSKNGKLVDKLPTGYFSTQAFTDFLLECVDEHKADDKPFFAYLSYQACHSPFAVPDEWLDKYKGQFDKGYEATRADRVARMKELGLLSRNATTFPRLPSIPAWDTLTPEQQKLSARRMERYAAMLENMDFNIGRVLEHLKAAGKLENTLVIFMSDNGAEPTELLALAGSVDPAMKAWLEKNWDTRPEAWGKKGSICDYGAAWAQVGSGPFRFFKAYVAEGGIRVPLIIAGPGVKHAGDKNDALLHATDLVPSLLEIAGAEHPSVADKKLAPLTGKSFAPILAGKASAVRSEDDWLGFELFGNRAIRQGDWKLCSILKGAGGTGEWQLFNLRDDPGETRDLAQEKPQQRDALLAHWDEYVQRNGVVLTGDGPFKRKSAAKEDEGN